MPLRYFVLDLSRTSQIDVVAREDSSRSGKKAYPVVYPKHENGRDRHTIETVGTNGHYHPLSNHCHHDADGFTVVVKLLTKNRSSSFMFSGLPRLIFVSSVVSHFNINYQLDRNHNCSYRVLLAYGFATALEWPFRLNTVSYLSSENRTTKHDCLPRNNRGIIVFEKEKKRGEMRTYGVTSNEVAILGRTMSILFCLALNLTQHPKTRTSNQHLKPSY